ncbi:hypothetical protein QW060_19560 [Myroides ceti]|uniref:Uncharacterized protein n=1 Tax=Paenimyroides ceti TaxID=395087 RepID=A0ABT8D1X6_9FLAO|nr:DUF5686 family protein [Paenimyroides ceti]MDN3709224.1 hypothetical protein [Paenimyroides ceti]
MKSLLFNRVLTIALRILARKQTHTVDKTIEYRDYNENDKKLAESSTRAYQDSLDKVHNKFNLFKLVQGYKYRNSYNNRTYKYNGLLSFLPLMPFKVLMSLPDCLISKKTLPRKHFMK